ncbi:glycosyl hydrolase family 28 protein [Aestuariivivens sediminis]|uniref:glycosyl hydrolase family 28 protein n=1 Tax=Aestuariivivens sediminis TaxID=2913557 RepID=UPI001F567D7A|nr:glycosyl hydrolase family 28 protein [Aestuariivivens sediminis]
MKALKIVFMGIAYLSILGLQAQKEGFKSTSAPQIIEYGGQKKEDGPRLTIYPAPPNEIRSGDYKVEVNGKPVDIYLAEIATVKNRPAWTLNPEDVGGPYSFCYFDFSGKVTIKVTALNKPLDHLVVRPLSTGIKPDIDGNTATFTIRKPCKLSIEPTGRLEPLLIFANPPEIDPPKKGDPNVIYFEPGLHKPEKIRLSTGQTLYIAGGAIVKGGVDVSGDNIKIMGRGILCGNDWEWRKGPGNMIGLRNASKVIIEDIIIRGAWSWTIPMYNCDTVKITNIKLVCSKNPNDDGINPCNSQRVYIRDCFIRTDDDCIAMKGIKRGSNNDNIEDIIVEDCILWSDRARVFLLGHESRASFMRDITLRDLDIIHFNMSPFLLEPGEEMSIENVFVENVRLYADYPKQSGERTFELIRLKPTINQYMKRQVPGKISKVYFKNMTLTGKKKEGWYPIWIVGADTDHMVTDITFENINWFGQVLDKNATQVKIDGNTKNIQFIDSKNK